ncbi:MAG: calcium-binding protein, partial [Phormidesmis sp.]
MANINGTDNNDFLKGTNGNDEIEGLGGNDLIEGLGGDDNLQGGLGTDVLIGGNGNDFLEGNKGTDFMIAGNGDDTMEWDNGDGSDIMDGGNGYDTVQVDGSVELGDEFVLQQRGTKAIFDRLNLVPFNLTVENSEVFNINGEGGDDSLIVGDLSQTAVKQVIFSGGKGNDLLDAPESSTQIQ